MLDSKNEEETVLIIDWSGLSPDNISDRINWLRNSLVAGNDWGYCEEAMTCVIMNRESSSLYKLRWFETDNQKLIKKPSLLDAALGAKKIMEEKENINVW